MRRGLDPARADAVARGLAPVALLFEPVSCGDRDTLALAARSQGLDCITGDGWAMIAGSASALAGLVRPGFSKLQPQVAESVGQLLQAVVQPTREWEMAR
ncbi:MAG: hypothetical protein IIA27_16320, partial [Gemmatimonadetes bacterium]|nr:hypothetical protein [Gemmatimonadota bacterium]